MARRHTSRPTSHCWRLRAQGRPAVTVDFTIALARALRIEHTRFVRSSSLGIGGKKTDRLIAILLSTSHYIAGPSAKDYIEPEKFEAAGIRLEYVRYKYPELSTFRSV